MIEKLTYRLRNNWHTMRWIVLIVGLVLMVQSVRYSDLLSAVLGGFFLFQAITNTGCLLGQGQCGVSIPENESKENTQIEFTEVTDN